MPLAKGEKFKVLKQKLNKQPGVNNPGALAAFIGRKKYGVKKFKALSTKGIKH